MTFTVLLTLHERFKGFDFQTPGRKLHMKKLATGQAVKNTLLLNSWRLVRNAARWMGICDTGSLTQVQGEVDRAGVLHSVKHGLALPPGGLLVAVEVSQVGDVVVQLGVSCVALVAGAHGAGLHAVVLGGKTAHVGGHHRLVEGCVLKLWNTSAGRPQFIVAGVHTR